MRVLLVEDDRKLCELLQMKMKKCDWFSECCSRGDEAMDYVVRESYDVIVLDRMLPGEDGLTVLKSIREKNIVTPVIMVTAMNQLADRVEGLDQGADDYLTKPFEVDEFLARVRALGRRTAPIQTNHQVSYGDLVFNQDQMCIQSGELTCRLTKREANLMTFLMKNHDRVLSRELILDRIWGIENDMTDCNLDNFIYFLRKRLKMVESKVQIKTVRGIGYRLEAEHD